MEERLSGILIAGSSNVGKTTLARRLADALGWRMISTDSLGRHPGRPWPQVRKPVAEYYSRLSPETICWFLKVHHENMWPRLEQIIKEESGAERRFVFEGSALRPEYIAPLVSEKIAGVCLYADADFLQARMRSEAKYGEADDVSRGLIDKFIERSLRDNSEMRASAKEHGLEAIDAADPDAVAGLFDRLTSRA
ncbi:MULTISPECIES: hypothetical protein [Rhizobium/Agrobacterium group]|uniref:AAA family ATPase n=1 Tax=Neorhizobium petrolearium TaxID=515361 RepID=A0ABY8M4V3_9HYPH|nr:MULTISPECIES: hypothetical protein [Rhizobium/Agrobacterium group]KGD99273.1 hypothetical protein JL39_13100 [Rhizobium sp. YS-1r]MCC2609264.1 hypothetical protein [Neorhizobium petrolearium]WGI69488.1 hypothetical protein QEO92_05235 [Neorhizobium petrolearium]